MAVNQDNLTYHDKVNIDNTKRLREIIATLPPFCREFFLGIKDTTSTRTRLAYAYDLRIFFEYLHENNPALKNTEVTSYQIPVIMYGCESWTIKKTKQ